MIPLHAMGTQKIPSQGVSLPVRALLAWLPMDERPPSPDTGDDSGTEYNREATSRIPRWVKLVGIALAVVVLLAVVWLLIGGGHGPPAGGHG